MSVFDKDKISFPKGWREEGTAFVVYSPEGAVAPSYAVRKIQTETGPKLELLTRQTDSKGMATWHPSKTPLMADPDRVIREAEFRQRRIGKSWTLDGDAQILKHKDGTFAARLLPDGSGKLELLTLQGPMGSQEWKPMKTPVEGSPETVFRAATARQAYIDKLKAGVAIPYDYPEGKDAKGNIIGIHPEGRFAVRQVEPGKLEILTAQFDKEGKAFHWTPAKTPFSGKPMDVYAEINRREFGIKMGKQEEKPVERAKGQQKAAAKAKGKDQGREM